MAKKKNKTETEVKDPGEVHAFQAEVSKLLHLMVHSVYTEREIFLRELISNASDACDKLRYLAITEDGLLGEDSELVIRIRPDAQARTLTISDNGVGMDHSELVENLGTIAKSGTLAFLEAAGDDSASAQQIGQFGVGFYAAFMVASRIEVTSRKAGQDDIWLWTSDGIGGFETSRIESDGGDGALNRGTSIKLFLKKDADEFLEPAELARIVSTYSDHVIFPVMLEGATGKGGEDGKDGAEGAEEEESEARQLNSGQAIWSRPKAEIKEEEYSEFFRQNSGQFGEPDVTLHYRAEGRHEYSVLLFVPGMKPFDLYDPARKGGIKLYVRRVFITDDAEILPPYLRFMKGVIDSEDMPLNISREMLQNNQIVQAIRKAVSNRVISELKKIAEKDQEQYLGIWDRFGPVLKEGLYEAPERRDDLFELARFRTSKSDDWTTLKDYVANMRENQTDIYFLTGDDLERMRSSPQLEGFRDRGVEVLLLCDPVDNFWVQSAAGFDGKPFTSITQGEADISNIASEGGDDNKKPETNAEIAGLTDKLKKLLEEAVSDVQISKRLVESPACLVAPSGGPDLGLEKILNMRGEGAGLLPVLEINGSHEIIKALASEGAEGAAEKFEDLGWLLFEQARIIGGDSPRDPVKFAERMNRIVLGSTGG